MYDPWEDNVLKASVAHIASIYKRAAVVGVDLIPKLATVPVFLYKFHTSFFVMSPPEQRSAYQNRDTTGSA